MIWTISILIYKILQTLKRTSKLNELGASKCEFLTNRTTFARSRLFKQHFRLSSLRNDVITKFFKKGYEFDIPKCELLQNPSCVRLVTIFLRLSIQNFRSSTLEKEVITKWKFQTICNQRPVNFFVDFQVRYVCSPRIFVCPPFKKKVIAKWKFKRTGTFFGTERQTKILVRWMWTYRGQTNVVWFL